MSKKHLGIIVSGIVIMATLTGCVMSSGCLDWFAGEWDNHYGFFISISTTEDLYNITLYLPILMVKGEISSLMYEMDYPSNWTWNITDTEYGKMLKISTDLILVGGNKIKVSSKPSHIINTQNPVGNEPTLYPRLNDTETEYRSYIYAKFNASTTNKFSIRMRMMGSKERGVLGANQLEIYRDIIEYTIIGEDYGWHITNGRLEC